MSFEKLGVMKPLLSAIKELGYINPTTVQTRAIPLVLAKEDVFATAQTGTGKTAAFGLPMLQRLRGTSADENRLLRGVILSPTRELSLQIHEDLVGYAKNMKLSIAVLVGGKDIEAQQRTLKKGVDIVIATPGRLSEHIDKGLKLNNVEIFVLDEADRISTQTMDMLKKTSIDNIDNCSFIFATNHIERFPEANLDRVDQISMLPRDKKDIIELKKSFFKRAVFILKSENVQFDSKVLQKYIIKCYPDFRKTIIGLQECFNTYGEINENILEYRAGINDTVINTLNSNIEPNEIIEMANNIDPIDFYYSFDEKICKYIEPSSLPAAYQIFTFYNSSHDKAISKNSHLVGCLMELYTAIKTGDIKIIKIKKVKE